MKVVHIVPAMEQGGVESVVLNLNRALCRAGGESVVISRGGKLVAEIERDGGRHIALEMKSKNPLTYFSRALELRKCLKSESPDLVCVHSRVPAWLFVWANRTLGLKWISYAHGANSVSRYSEVMTKGDLVITPSKYLADFLTENYRFDASKLRVIPNAIDLEKFDPGKLDRAFIEAKRREWGIKDGQRVVMSIGRITPIKGFDVVIRETPKTDRLIIVGGADKDKVEYLEHLKSLAGANVVFAGAQTKIAECLALADEVVSGNVTKPESFGLSVAEAYAMNKPVKAKRFGGVAEIMASVESELASGRAKNYREAVRNRYGFDIISQTTISTYEELIENDSI